LIRQSIVEGEIGMAEGDLFRQISKNAWYRVSIYVNIVLFFIIAIFMYFLIRDSINYGEIKGEAWRFITLDVSIIAVSFALIFYQFFRNLYTILRRSL